MPRLLLLSLVLLTSCNQPRVDTRRSRARVFRITDPQQLVSGPAATGAVGDFRLQNGLIAVVISDHPAAMGFSESGGNLIDAATRGGKDTLGQMFLYLDETFPRQAIYDRVEIGQASGNFASVAAFGHDSVDPSIKLATEYRLDVGKNYVTITTFITPHKRPLTDYQVGDVLQWGANVHFVPQKGFLSKGRHTTVPWIGAVGARSSYGYATQTAFDLLNGSAWSDTVVATLNLAYEKTDEPGRKSQAGRVTRYFVIGDAPDLANLLPSLAHVRDKRLAHVSGRVLDEQKQPVVGARVLAEDEHGHPLATAATHENGRFVLPLADGSAVLFAESSGRGKSAKQNVRVPTSGIRLRLPAPATLDIRIHERTPQGARPSPGKVTVIGRAGTATPNFGPRHSAQGASNIRTSADGRLNFELPAGSYSIVVSRGPEFNVARLEIALAPGDTRTLSFALARVVDTRGYLSGDFHQHSFYSGDSGILLGDRITSNLAEGVELAIATEHNQVVDLSAIVKTMDAEVLIKVLPGLEATTQTIGHFNAYPASASPGPRGGAVTAFGDQSAQQVFSLLRKTFPEAVLQVNHPRAHRIGYFDALGFDRSGDTQPRALSLAFDAIEILNGKRTGDLDAVMLDWFWLLSHGHVVTATGGSDSHAIVGEEAGYPRTYFAVADDQPAKLTPAMLTRAIKSTRDVVLSNGPFVTLKRQKQSAIGRTYTVARGESFEFELTVQAATWVDVTSIEIVQGLVGSNRPPTAVRIAVHAPREQVVRYNKPLFLRAKEDSWVVVVVRGKKSLYPVVQGRKAPPTPVAVTNPVWLKVADR